MTWLPAWAQGLSQAWGGMSMRPWFRDAGGGFARWRPDLIGVEVPSVPGEGPGIAAISAALPRGARGVDVTSRFFRTSGSGID